MRHAAAGMALLGMAAAVAGAAPKKAPKPAAKAPEKLVGPMAFRPAEVDLAPGESLPVELMVPSPTGKAFRGELAFTPAEGVSVKPDSRWTGRLPPWGVKTFPRVIASTRAEGKIPVEAALENGGKAVLTVNVTPPPVEVVPEYRKLRIRVANPFAARLLPGRVVVSNPDRFLQDITTREFKVPPGETQELEIPLPGYAAVDGETYDFTVKVESYHGYRSTRTYPLQFPPQPQKLPAGVGK